MEDEMPLPIVGALLSLAGLVAAFCYTAGYRFLKELIDAAGSDKPRMDPRHRRRIRCYYLFSDFVLDYLFGGSLSALVVILHSQWCKSEGSDTIRIVTPKVWYVIFIVILIFWGFRKAYKNRDAFLEGHGCTLIRSVIETVLSFTLVGIIVAAEFHSWPCYSCLNSFKDVINLLTPKFMALGLWLVFGLVWGPFSAYAAYKNVLRE